MDQGLTYKLPLDNQLAIAKAQEILQGLDDIHYPLDVQISTYIVAPDGGRPYSTSPITLHRYEADKIEKLEDQLDDFLYATIPNDPDIPYRS